jgi:hypothetical protein
VEKEKNKVPVKVIIEFDDKIISVEGDEAAKFWNHIENLCVMASIRAGTQNPFERDPIDWEEENK